MFFFFHEVIIKNIILMPLKLVVKIQKLADHRNK